MEMRTLEDGKVTQEQLPDGTWQYRFTCDVCHAEKTHIARCSTGYGKDSAGRLVCFECCAEQDREELKTQDRWTGYFTPFQDTQATSSNMGHVSNWTGSLKIPCTYAKSSGYGFGRSYRRYDVWFTAPDGSQWYGVNQGNSQIVRCRRLKNRRIK